MDSGNGLAGNTRVVINRNKTASESADVVYYGDYFLKLIIFLN